MRRWRSPNKRWGRGRITCASCIVIVTKRRRWVQFDASIRKIFLCLGNGLFQERVATAEMANVKLCLTASSAAHLRLLVHISSCLPKTDKNRRWKLQLGFHSDRVIIVKWRRSGGLAYRERRPCGCRLGIRAR